MPTTLRRAGRVPLALLATALVGLTAAAALATMRPSATAAAPAGPTPTPTPTPMAAPPLISAAAVGPSWMPSGTIFTYQLVVQNTGGDSAVTVEGQLDAALEVEAVSGADAAASCSSLPCTFTLPGASAAAVAVTTWAPPGPCGTLQVTFIVSVPGQDPVVSNTVSTRLTPCASDGPTTSPPALDPGPGQPLLRRIDRDRTRRCIPERPDTQPECDPMRAALWYNARGELTGVLHWFGVAQPTPADILLAYIRIHAAAGDLDVVAQVSQQQGWPNLRAVAVGIAADVTREYVELQNVGGAPAPLEGLQLRSPDGSNTFTFARGALQPGQSCLVWSQPLGQPLACPGSWASLNGAPIWPAAGAWIMQYYPPLGTFTDRWYYHP